MLVVCCPQGHKKLDKANFDFSECKSVQPASERGGRRRHNVCMLSSIMWRYCGHNGSVMSIYCALINTKGEAAPNANHSHCLSGFMQQPVCCAGWPSWGGPAAAFTVLSQPSHHWQACQDVHMIALQICDGILGYKVTVINVINVDSWVRMSSSLPRSPSAAGPWSASQKESVYSNMLACRS